jgi:pectate lyase
MDHVSMAWSTDESFSCWQKTDYIDSYNITIQRSILAEALQGHSTNLQISGENEEWKRIQYITIHHNLFIHTSHRNPRVQAKAVEVINNVVYNWDNRIGTTIAGAELDYINNYNKNGPIKLMISQTIQIMLPIL